LYAKQCKNTKHATPKSTTTAASHGQPTGASPPATGPLEIFDVVTCSFKLRQGSMGCIFVNPPQKEPFADGEEENINT